MIQMKTKNLLMVMALSSAAIFESCTDKESGIDKFAQTTGIKLENMDQSVKPGTDFYRYACGEWMKNNPLKPEYARFGSIDIIEEENDKRIREIIEGLAAAPQEKGTLGQKIGDLYALRMDSVRQNKEGVVPVKVDLNRVAAAESTTQLMTLMSQMLMEGVSFGELWGSYISADMMSSKENLLELSQGGYSIDRDYYVKDDEANRKILEAYRQHIVKMFQLTGETADEAQRKMENVMRIEMRMAKAGKSNVELPATTTRCPSLISPANIKASTGKPTSMCKASRPLTASP